MSGLYRQLKEFEAERKAIDKAEQKAVLNALKESYASLCRYEGELRILEEKETIECLADSVRGKKTAGPQTQKLASSVNQQYQRLKKAEAKLKKPVNADIVCIETESGTSYILPVRCKKIKHQNSIDAQVYTMLRDLCNPSKKGFGNYFGFAVLKDAAKYLGEKAIFEYLNFRIVYKKGPAVLKLKRKTRKKHGSRRQELIGLLEQKGPMSASKLSQELFQKSGTISGRRTFLIAIATELKRHDCFVKGPDKKWSFKK